MDAGRPPRLSAFLTGPVLSVAHPDQLPDLDALCDRVINILVDTFDFSADEARQRLALWRSLQHDLAGEALGALLPAMSQAERDTYLVQWALESALLRGDLREGAARLGFDLAD